MADEHPFVRLARTTIEHYVRTGQVIGLPEKLPGELGRRAGTFVSLHRGGELRGCIGTIEPVRDSLAEEIIANAISAATRRFRPKNLPTSRSRWMCWTSPSRSSRWESWIPNGTASLCRREIGGGCCCPILRGWIRQSNSCSSLCARRGSVRRKSTTCSAFRSPDTHDSGAASPVFLSVGYRICT